MVLLVEIFTIVVAHSIDQTGTFLRVFPSHVVRGKGSESVFFRVMLFNLPQQHDKLHQPFVPRMHIIYLVSDAPHDNTWVVPVAPYPALHILLRTLRKKSSVVILCLSVPPHVKCL